MIKFPISLLFVPANRLDWIEKGEATNADALILDLEDSIPANEKKEAREGLLEYFSNQKPKNPYLIRINPLDSSQGQKDLLFLKKAKNVIDNLLALVIPKLENLEELSSIPKSFKVIPLIETPLAVKNLDVLASAPGVLGVALGAADLSTNLGSDMSWDGLLYCRSRLVLHASINGLYSIDSPFVELDLIEQLEEECKRSKSLGFTSKAAVHPDQVDIIRKNFLPSEEEINEAKKILKSYSDSKGGAIAVDGKMVDGPIVQSMKKKLLLVGLDPGKYK